MNPKSKITYQIAIKFQTDRIGYNEILKDILLSLGVTTENIIELLNKDLNSYLFVYFVNKVQAKRLTQKLRSLGLKHVQIQFTSLKPEDWQTKWKENFKPFHLTKNFFVVPTWLKKKNHHRRAQKVYIDTGIAFGTGLHATTRFMASLIERERNKIDSFLDIGTGTGILAIIAHYCGAKEITALDISQDAVKAAKENLLENGDIKANVRCCNIKNFKKKKAYDFVAANLISFDLIENKRKILSLVKPGKYLAVSGISYNSYKLLREAFDPLPLKCLKIERGEGWLALLYKRDKK